MVRPKKLNQKQKNNGATIGFEARLWQAADKLRSNTDAAMEEAS